MMPLNKGNLYEVMSFFLAMLSLLFHEMTGNNWFYLYFFLFFAMFTVHSWMGFKSIDHYYSMRMALSGVDHKKFAIVTELLRDLKAGKRGKKK